MELPTLKGFFGGKQAECYFGVGVGLAGGVLVMP
jgi:hypothetical protein